VAAGEIQTLVIGPAGRGQVNLKRVVCRRSPTRATLRLLNAKLPL
jgi:hypothetical protein